MENIFNFLTWKLEGLCGTLDQREWDRLFFSQGVVKNETKELCDSCPVKDTCLNYGILYDEEGVWAATTKSQRDLVRPVMLPHLLEEAISSGHLEPRFYHSGGEENQPEKQPPSEPLKELDDDVWHLVDEILLDANVPGVA